MTQSLALRLASCSLALAAATTATATTQAPLFTLAGDANGQQFGWSVGRAHDVNRDGFADVIVGMHLDSARAPWAGAATVISGRSGIVLHTVRGDAAGDRLGHAVSGLKDVDGDGFADLIAGAPYADVPALDAGAARVFSGRDGSTLFTIRGLALADHLGWSVAGAGDVNGDGVPDAVIGSPSSDLSGTDAGRVIVVSGRDGTLLWQFRGDAAQDQLGWSVAGAGDVDRDGFADVIGGAPQAFNGGIGYARIWSGKNGSTIRTIRGFNGGDQLGNSVDGAGDVDRDGVPDAVIGMHESHRPGTYAGSAIVVSGSTGTVLHRFDGEWDWGSFGTAVAGIGDVNGDGAADVVAGAVGGYVKVFSGSDGSVLLRLFEALDRSFGTALAALGDVDGDGTGDFAAGAWRTDLQGNNRAGSALVFPGRKLSLAADAHVLPLPGGGTQTFALDAGLPQASRPYLLLGSLAGIRPGLVVGPLRVPLNPDAWFEFTLSSPNTFPLVNSSGRLDSAARATAAFVLPPGLPGVLDGTRFDHAFVVLDPGTGGLSFASNSVPLTLVK
jgi:hypothetical protein